METPPRLVESTEHPVVLSADTSAYLARLAQEQSKFLGALADASSLLPADATQVPKMASIQCRLTREFFDAQRAIIRRRAETDEAIRRIGNDAEETAGSLLAEARARAAMLHGGRPLAVPRSDARPVPLAAPAPTAMMRTGAPVGRHAVAEPSPSTSVRRQISDLGVTVVRNRDDVDELAELIDDALEPSEPDGAVVKRQLREVLDEWWRSELQEGTAAIDDANARAAMRLHLARIEAEGVVQRADDRCARLAPDVYRHQPSRVLPTPMIDALDHTDHEHLDDVLASMLDALEPAAVGADTVSADPTDEPDRGAAPIVAERDVVDRPPLPTPVLPPAVAPLVPPSEVITRLPGRPVGPGGIAAHPQPDDGFWSAPSSSRQWVFPHVLLPAVAVIGALAFVLALVG